MNLPALARYQVLCCAVVVSACSGGNDVDSQIEEYARMLSPDGEVSASVYHYDSANGGLTQVSLDFIGLSF